MNNQIAIVYMVAGISSRFGGKIKQFANVGPNNETLIEYSLNQALEAGFNKIIFIVGNLTEKPFKEKFKSSYKGVPIYYALQTYDAEKRDRPWGTADAIYAIKPIIDCPFVICNGDDIYGKNTLLTLHKHLRNSNEEATIGYRLEDGIPETGSVNRGIFTVKDNYVEDLTEVFNIEKSNLEKTDSKLDDFCSMNIFALHKNIVDLIGNDLILFKEKFKEDRKKEALLPEFISNLVKNNKIKMRIYKTPDKWIGVTNPADELIVKDLLKDYK